MINYYIYTNNFQLIDESEQFLTRLFETSVLLVAWRNRKPTYLNNEKNKYINT